MKLKNLLPALFAGLVMFASCNKDNEEEKNNVTKQNASVDIRINTGSLRAPGASFGSNDNYIDKVQVYIYAGGTLDGYAEKVVDGTTEDVEIKGVSATVGERNLYVVANMDLAKDLSETNLKAAMSEMNEDLAKIGKKIPMCSMAGESSIVDAIKATEVSPVSITIAKGKNGYGYPADATYDNKFSVDKPLLLVRDVAKILVERITVAMEGIYAGYELQDQKIVLLNAKKKSDVFSNAKALDDDNFIAGIELTGSTSYYRPKATTKVDYLEKVYAEGDGFYAFSNQSYTNEDGKRSATLLVLQGNLRKADGTVFPAKPGQVGADGLTYYPIAINLTGTIESNADAQVIADGKIYRNQSYSLKVKIKRAGSDNPYDPPVDVTSLDVKCAIAPFVEYTQDVEF